MNQDTTILYPGSFDPITVGHLDVIIKTIEMFGRVTIVVAQSEHKNYMFTSDQRVRMIKAATNQMPENINVIEHSGMMGNLIEEYADQTKQWRDVVIVRGLRDNVDFHEEMTYEQYTAEYGANTFYVTPNPENIFVSSSLVRAHIQTGSIPINDVPQEIPQEIIPMIGQWSNT